MKAYFISFFYAVVVLSAFCLVARAQNGKPPVVVIPGITGSQLVNGETGKTVWFSLNLGNELGDDLRLPMFPDLAQNRDTIVAKDIIRKIELPGILRVFPDTHVYDRGIEALVAAGYTEATWENPRAEDSFYVFAYDWRRDNVESARLLIEKIEAVKTRLDRPDLKFDLVAHSMGGMIARYAAMYGKTDLPAGDKKPNPTWAGARHIERLLLFGTPSEGSFSAFETLVRGYRIGRGFLTFDRMSKEDVFTIPALYQLMPYGESALVLDDQLKPISVDLYDPANWRKYGWGALGNPKFPARLTDAAQTENHRSGRGTKTVDDQIHAQTTRAQAEEFLRAVLRHALKFHQALSVRTPTSPIETFIYGGNCEDTLSGVVLIRNDEKGTWETLTAPRGIKTAAGRKISKEQMKKAIYAVGDGRVSVRSLLLGSATFRAGATTTQPGFPVKSTSFSCVQHVNLLNHPKIREQFLTILGKPVEAKPIN